ncbi:hypothetical protein TRFO_11752 [Tritrichomonas foetus]|uniref:Uncharacterized protein n=1 Tax=Tritrichomonas foetus TaxID=1144522 RepID=A0A1J4J225_9EUKA|nr:hypothetical protein TRFO_11752 [Tritrichomonas foetus]|eukprot:OHS93536.1 hypothetical protein TRFO_11752 [Tritrichomonas foetus]
MSGLSLSPEQTQSIIKLTIETQRFLHNEMIFEEYEKSITQGKEKQNEIYIRNILCQFKQYWQALFLLKTNDVSKYSKNFLAALQNDENHRIYCDKPTALTSEGILSDFEENCMKLDKIMKITKKEKKDLNEKEKRYIYYITLNLVPSIHDFFLTKEKMKKYFQLIHKVPKIVHEFFIETLFLEPEFIDFAATLFRQIFITYETNNKLYQNTSPKEIIREMFISWQNNLNLCPSYIFDFFDFVVKEKKYSEYDVLLIFFKLLFEHPILYQLSEFYGGSNENQLPKEDLIQALLTKDDQENGSYIFQFYEVFRDFQQNHYHSKDSEEDTLQQLLPVYTADVYDSQFYSFFEEKQFVDADSYINDKKYHIYHKYPQEQQKEEQINEGSICGDISFTEYRDLLKLSNPIPIFEIEKFQTFEDYSNFLETFLVKRGSMKTFARRISLFQTFINNADDLKHRNPRFNLFNHLNDELKKMKIDHERHVENLIKITRIGDTINRTTVHLNSALANTMNCLLYKYLLQDKNVKIDNLSHFILHPNIDELLKYKNECFNENAKDFQKLQIPYILHSSDLRFDKFLERRSELIMYDNNIESILKFTKINFIDPEFEKYPKITNVLKNIFPIRKSSINNKQYLQYLDFNKKFNLIAWELNRSFSAFTDPFQKLLDIHNSITSIKSLIFREAVLSDKDISESDVQFFLTKIIFLVIHPPNLISAFVYIFEFILSDHANEIDILTGNLLNRFQMEKYKTFFESCIKIVESILNKKKKLITFHELLFTCQNHKNIIICSDCNSINTNEDLNINPNKNTSSVESDSFGKNDLKTEILANCIPSYSNMNLSNYVKSLKHLSLKLPGIKNNRKYYVCNVFNVNTIKEFISLVNNNEAENKIDLMIIVFNGENDHPKQFFDRADKSLFKNGQKNIVIASRDDSQEILKKLMPKQKDLIKIVGDNVKDFLVNILDGI